MRIFLIAGGVLACAVGGAVALATLHGARPGQMPQISAPQPDAQAQPVTTPAPMATAQGQTRPQVTPKPAPVPALAVVDPAPASATPAPVAAPAPRAASRLQKTAAPRSVADTRPAGGADVINLSQMPGALADPGTDRMMLLPPATQAAPGANLRDPSRNWVIGVYR